MSFFSYSHNRALRLALGVVALLILFPALFRIVFAAQDEVSYSAGVGVSTCDDFYISDASELSRCTASYAIRLGNTGSNHQEFVVVELSSVPAEYRLNWNVLDIVATDRRPIGPSIRYQRLGDSLRIEVRDLEPNRLVEIAVSSRGIESVRQLEDITISVQATGSIVRSNPRLTVTLRFLRNLGGILGF